MGFSPRLAGCFVRALGIDPTQVTADLVYNGIREWDSVAHMALVTELENEYELMLDTDEILGLNSVPAAHQMLIKHGIEDAS